MSYEPEHTSPASGILYLIGIVLLLFLGGLFLGYTIRREQEINIISSLEYVKEYNSCFNIVSKQLKIEKDIKIKKEL